MLLNEETMVFQRLGEQIEAAMVTYQVPGVAVGLIHAGREQVAGWGVTNIDHPLPVDGDTLFQIGSTTKTVTATVALQLVEQGKLDLDTPIRAYLPDLRLADEAAAAGVTLRHLFTHTGGWMGDYFDDTGPGDDALDRIVARMVDLPQLTPLGAMWSYNNAGFYLAGRVIEVVSGRPYEAVVRERVFDPLGMNMSFFFAGDAITHRVAAGHGLRDEALTVLRPWPLARAAHPAGGITSTARDQLRYARFHMGDGAAPGITSLLTPESLALMQTPVVPADTRGMMALTWFVTDRGATRIFSHGGATLGQMSAFLFAPAHDFALTILTNAERGRELNRDVTKWALQHFLGVDDPDPAPQDVPDEQLAAYAGRYTSLMQDLELTMRDGMLVLQDEPKGGFPTRESPPRPALPPTRLAFYGPDLVVALDPPYSDARGEFLRDADGTLTWLRIGGRLHRRAG
jgi:CubicO group peptidase (beta-lactamase class C family)